MLKDIYQEYLTGNWQIYEIHIVHEINCDHFHVIKEIQINGFYWKFTHFTLFGRYINEEIIKLDSVYNLSYNVFIPRFAELNG